MKKWVKKIDSIIGKVTDYILLVVVGILTIWAIYYVNIEYYKRLIKQVIEESKIETV